jgi:exosortase
MTVNHDEQGLPSPEPLRVDRSAASLGDLVKASLTDPANRPTLIGAAICLAILCLLFYESLEHFHYAWTTDDNYSHGFLVPFISLYFAGQIFKRGPVPVRSGAVLGGFLLGFAILVHLVTIPLPIPFLGDLAFLVALAGAFTILAGTAALKRYWFVFFFLIFMVPLPVALYARIASPLQLMASQVASAFMNATGVPVLCEGNRMTLPGGVQMFVAEACSGMRQLTGFLALSTAVAYLCVRPMWYRVILVAAALPIALFANITRVVVTGYIMHFVNPAYASGAYHTMEGVLLMGFGLFLLNSVCMLMDLFCVKPPDADADGEAKTDSDADVDAGPPRAGRAILQGADGWAGGRITGKLSLSTSEELP